ncbi:MAG: tRNA uridine-5-carboxymethylaminomethyl(34) synthesis GTPase MnmE [Rhodobacteraceae bacterium]|jgi:tRNA modification GTPase|nr:tRNA uridine-5-carboxymethylaminomethyl(34) synthesis GTPase MnmE [Paracoccaceae bacterium]
MDTIFAPATARGRAGLAVLRLSGPCSHAAVRRLAGRVPPSRRLVRAGLRDAAGSLLDDAMVVVFDAGASFTAEEAAELHLHGSAAVVAAVLRVLGAMPGLRMAEPGEFARRALENGRLDLTQVEGLADLIEAETEAQRRQAIAVAGGALGRQAEGWRSDLLRAAALVEATIDFADEDLPRDVTPEAAAAVDRVRSGLAALLAGSAAAERVRDGFEVAIVGRPNVGKSTLLNALAGREAALTSEVEGTTRDVIEVRMDIGGLAVTLLDTAGLRPTQDVLEGMGVALARRRAAAADLRVVLIDDRGLPDGFATAEGDIVVRARVDRPQDGPGVSGLTGHGVAALLDAIGARLEGRVAGASSLIRERQRQAVTRAAGALEQAAIELSAPCPRAELAAEDLRSAIRALEGLVGRVDVEHLLDEIFARFCIGK